MSRLAVALLLALIVPQAAAGGLRRQPAQTEVDPAAASDQVVAKEPEQVVTVAKEPEQEAAADDSAVNLAADAVEVNAADAVEVTDAQADADDEVEEDAMDDDEEGEAGVDTAEQDKTMSGASIDEVVSMQQKESTEEVDEATQKMAAELEISEEDEADDVDEDGDEEEEDEASEDEDSEDTSAEDPIDEM
mmetsp:Transcript_31841/g.94655  ORF Transcript_31841/g.94655 Transcript_31841/m.94655 type:complete len:191 (-) Transcript_31841:55-627(-)